MKSLRSRTHRTLCEALVEARKSAGLSQHELARRLKRSQSFIAKLEVGERRDPSLAAVALGVSRGCRIVRVHDVAGTRRVVDVLAGILAA